MLVINRLFAFKDKDYTKDNLPFVLESEYYRL